MVLFSKEDGEQEHAQSTARPRLAAGSAHYWAREIERLGHTVRLMSPQFVTPYRKGNKNGPNDAEVICEAVTRPSMRFVPVKRDQEQDILALHWVRDATDSTHSTTGTACHRGLGPSIRIPGSSSGAPDDGCHPSR